MLFSVIFHHHGTKILLFSRMTLMDASGENLKIKYPKRK